MPRTKGSENKTHVQKNKKEVNSPKKGKSSFFFYLDARKEAAKKKNPGLQHKELISELSQEWKTLSKDEKLPYIILANKDKERFLKEKEALKSKQIQDSFEEKKVEIGKRKPEKNLSEEPQICKKTKIVNYL